MFELIFLGTAAAVPSAERGSPALLIARGPERFLVDCGEGTQRQLMCAPLGFRGLGHVLLTHLHLDHVAGLAGLLATRQLYQLEGAIEIVGSRETVALAGRYLSITIGSQHEAGYRLRAVCRARY
jgi:ribonuclease Z